MINSLGAYVQNVFVSLPSHEASQQQQQLPTAVSSPTMLSGLPIGMAADSCPLTNNVFRQACGSWIRILFLSWFLDPGVKNLRGKKEKNSRKFVRSNCNFIKQI